MTRTLSAWAAVLALAGGACSGGDEPAPAPPQSSGAGAPSAGGTPVAAVGDPAKGREIYGNVCATCHGGSPSEAGTAGPAIAGSSLELVEAKVLRGEYPPGYTPQRGSKAMPPLPYLKDHVVDIAAFLQAAQDG